MHTYLFLIFIQIYIFFISFSDNGYQRKKEAKIQRKKHDFQLSRLRVASNSMMTEFNPNYEFGGGTYTINDLKDIPRDNLRLVKALGQGAFGEVYQGLYRHRTGDAVEMPVAVKVRIFGITKSDTSPLLTPLDVVRNFIESLLQQGRCNSISL